jgi:hypothetical protein
MPGSNPITERRVEEKPAEKKGEEGVTTTPVEENTMLNTVVESVIHLSETLQPMVAPFTTLPSVASGFLIASSEATGASGAANA